MTTKLIPAPFDDKNLVTDWEWWFPYHDVIDLGSNAVVSVDNIALAMVSRANTLTFIPIFERTIHQETIESLIHTFDDIVDADRIAYKHNKTVENGRVGHKFNFYWKDED